MKTRVKDLFDLEVNLRANLGEEWRCEAIFDLEYESFAYGRGPVKPLCSALWLTVYEELENET